MIVVNGKQFRTLDDEITVNGAKVYEVWVGDDMVYPVVDDDVPETPGEGSELEVSYIPNPFLYYESVTFDELFTVERAEEIGLIMPDGSRGVMYETITFECNGFGCAIVNQRLENPRTDSDESWKPGEQCSIPVFDCEYYTYYDQDLQSDACASKWTLYDGGPGNDLRLYRFYILNDKDHDGSVVAFKNGTRPLECLPRNYVKTYTLLNSRDSTPVTYDTRDDPFMRARYFHDRTSISYVWNIPDDPPYDAVTTLGSEGNYLWSKSFKWSEDDLSDPWSWSTNRN